MTTLKRVANNIPMDILLVAKITMPPIKLIAANTEKITKKT
jgi:hypothetical protein